MTARFVRGAPNRFGLFPHLVIAAVLTSSSGLHGQKLTGKSIDEIVRPGLHPAEKKPHTVAASVPQLISILANRQMTADDKRAAAGRLLAVGQSITPQLLEILELLRNDVTGLTNSFRDADRRNDKAAAARIEAPLVNQIIGLRYVVTVLGELRATAALQPLEQLLQVELPGQKLTDSFRSTVQEAITKVRKASPVAAPNQAPTAPPPRATSSTVLQPQGLAGIFSKEAENVLIFVDLAASTEFVAAIRQGNQDNVSRVGDRLAQSDRLFVLRVGTTVRLIEKRDVVWNIQVTEGPSANRRGWVLEMYVRPADDPEMLAQKQRFTK